MAISAANQVSVSHAWLSLRHCFQLTTPAGRAARGEREGGERVRVYPLLPCAAAPCCLQQAG